MRRYVANLVGVALIATLLAVGVWVLQHGERADGVLVGTTNEPLYSSNDPWAEYLAPESVCPGGEDRSAPIAAQEQTMVCLVNFARLKRGLDPLPENPTLSEGARAKALDIESCTDFAHDACGKKPWTATRDAGYWGGSWGENLFLGPSEYGRPRVAIDRWLNSQGHRDNLFREWWEEQGIALRRVATFDGHADTAIWVSQFGLP